MIDSQQVLHYTLRILIRGINESIRPEVDKLCPLYQILATREFWPDPELHSDTPWIPDLLHCLLQTQRCMNCLNAFKHFFSRTAYHEKKPFTSTAKHFNVLVQYSNKIITKNRKFNRTLHTWYVCSVKLQRNNNNNNNNNKGKVHPRTGHGGPEGEQRYSSTLSLTSVLDGGGWSTPRPVRFTQGRRPGTYCTERWVGQSASLDGCGKSRSHRDSIPGPSSP